MTDKKNKVSNQKRNVIIPIVLILGVFIGGVLVLQTRNIGATILKEGKKIFVPVAEEPNADPDNDGLKNWEEEVYKTDPRKYDTDGDGYSDGEEVLSGYDPTKPAPNDALKGTDTSVPRPTPKNLTDYLSQLIVSKVESGEFKPISNTKTAPDSVLLNNEDIFNEVLSNISEKAKTEFVLPKIPDSEIKISKNPTTKREVVVYITKMSAVMDNNKVFTDIGLSEAKIIEDAINTKDTRNIEKIINSYQVGIEKIKEITVPLDFVDIHKEQLAIFEFTKKILVAIKNFESDPAMAAAAAERYPELKNMLKSFTNKLIDRLEKYSDDNI